MSVEDTQAEPVTLVLLGPTILCRGRPKGVMSFISDGVIRLTFSLVVYCKKLDILTIKRLDPF